MLRGIALAFLTYAVFSWNDATIKGLGGRLPVFEIMFFSMLFTCITIAFLRPPGERWRDMFRMNHPEARAAAHRSARSSPASAGTYAFTTIPLAEAYALMFMAPVFVTILSIFILGEPVGWRRLTAVAIGFAGIMLVVKPGFRELHPGHFAAALVAVGRRDQHDHHAHDRPYRAAGEPRRRRHARRARRRAALLTLTDFHPVAFNDEIVRLVASGVFVGIGQVLMLAATRAAPANRVAPAQYSQMVWAVLLGAVFYNEIPDTLCALSAWSSSACPGFSPSSARTRCRAGRGAPSSCATRRETGGARRQPVRSALIFRNAGGRVETTFLTVLNS